jgi:thiol-disulfide isomerase/thioredoxin
VIYFYAPWCQHCMESEPYFKQAGSAWTSAACKHTDMYPFRLCTCTVYLHYHRILVYALPLHCL